MDAVAAAAEPRPPSKEEAKWYYRGLGNLPKLVARTSRTPFVLASEAPRLRPVEVPLPPGLVAWNNGRSDLRVEVLQALAPLQWTAVDVLSFGTDEAHPPTLLVSVQPKSTSWEHGLAVAIACKTVLQSHGLDEMDCEIRESVPHYCAGLKLVPAGYVFQEFERDTRDFVSTEIAAEKTPHYRGTKGLYLTVTPDQPDGQPKIVALTCRHLLLQSHEAGIERYDAGPDKEQHHVVQMTQEGFEMVLGQINRQIDGNRHILRPGCTTPLLDSTRQWAETDLAYFEKMHGLVAPCQDPALRKIGHVLAAGKMAAETRDDGHSWFSDWAIIELSQESHQTTLTSLKNDSWLPKKRLIDQIRENRLEPLSTPFQTSADLFSVRLQKEHVPLDEFLVPSDVADEHSVAPNLTGMVVMKVGAETGPIRGTTSILKSLVRKQIEGYPTVVSEHIPVIGGGNSVRTLATFARLGDSGACVWDFATGRPLGIIDSGLTEDECHLDVTYVQPMAFILDEIARHGYKDVAIL